jgi:hypothetical protein
MKILIALGVVVILVPIFVIYYVLKAMKAQKNTNKLKFLLIENGYKSEFDFLCTSKNSDKILFIDPKKGNVVFASVNSSDYGLRNYPLSGLKSAGIYVADEKFTTDYAPVSEEDVDQIVTAVMSSEESQEIKVELDIVNSTPISLQLFSDKDIFEKVAENVIMAGMLITEINRLISDKKTNTPSLKYSQNNVNCTI